MVKSIKSSKFSVHAPDIEVRTPVRLNLRVCRLSILVGLNHKIFLSIPIVFVYIIYITST